MLKKISAVIFVFSFCFCGLVEAVMYANADPNYPIWMTGNRHGMALDLISSVEIPVKHSFQVCCLNYSIDYEKGDGEYYEYGKLESNGYVYFREHDGEIYYALSNVPTNNLEWKKANWTGKDVFQLVKRQVKYK